VGVTLKRVVILRGVSGSGKTTYAKTICAQHDEVVVCSADDFFMHQAWNPDKGSLLEYQFDPARLGEAHTYCFGKFLDALYQEGDRVIIVDNTFIHKWEIENYLKAAWFVGAVVEVHEIRIQTLDELQECIRRNVHRVPPEVVTRMALEFEPMDGAVVVPFFFNQKVKA